MTIIVLLILAGISIQMLTGDNGILQRAGEAKERMDEAQIRERIQLAYHSALAGGKGSYTKDTLMDELQKEFKTGYDVDDSDDTNWKMKAQGQEVTIPAGITNKEKTLASQIKAENYGDSVTYTANGVSDWKIFYNDGTNVYIITSDYLPNNKIDLTTIKNNGMELKTSGNYCICGVQSSEYQNRIDFVNTLNNTENWIGFANGTSNGNTISGGTAYGAPNLEMWINSWNQKGYKKLFYKTEQKQKDSIITYTSYYVGDSENPNSVSLSFSMSEDGYKDILYYPHSFQSAPDSFTTSNNCWGYWLASAAATQDEIVLVVVHPSQVTCTRFDASSLPRGDSTIGIRPVVCLPLNVIGNFENGSWNLKL